MNVNIIFLEINEIIFTTNISINKNQFVTFKELIRYICKQNYVENYGYGFLDRNNLIEVLSYSARSNKKNKIDWNILEDDFNLDLIWKFHNDNYITIIMQKEFGGDQDDWIDVIFGNMWIFKIIKPIFKNLYYDFFVPSRIKKGLESRVHYKYDYIKKVVENINKPKLGFLFLEDNKKNIKFEKKVMKYWGYKLHKKNYWEVK